MKTNFHKKLRLANPTLQAPDTAIAELILLKLNGPRSCMLLRHNYWSPRGWVTETKAATENGYFYTNEPAPKLKP